MARADRSATRGRYRYDSTGGAERRASRRSGSVHVHTSSPDRAALGGCSGSAIRIGRCRLGSDEPRPPSVSRPDRSKRHHHQRCSAGRPLLPHHSNHICAGSDGNHCRADAQSVGPYSDRNHRVPVHHLLAGRPTTHRSPGRADVRACRYRATTPTAPSRDHADSCGPSAEHRRHHRAERCTALTGSGTVGPRSLLLGVLAVRDPAVAAEASVRT
jgi:hypothetical protein